MPIARSSVLRPAVCALLASLAIGPIAAAQTQPADPTALAVALFLQARDLFKQERYADACPKFAESQRLEPKLGTLLNLAVCNEKLGKIATAWAEYTTAEGVARREGQKERGDFAREQITDLEKKLARVVLQVGALGTSEAGLAITLDDQPLAAAVLSTPLPVDPGKHRVAATAPGKIAWSTEIDVPAEQAEIRVPIPALEAAPPPVPAVVPVAPPPILPLPVVSAAPIVAPPPAPPPSSTGAILAYAGFSVGGVGLLLGAITGGLTLSQASTIRDRCPGDRCTGDKDQSDINAATTLANASNIGFAIGAIGLGTGVVGLFLSRSSAPVARAGVVITPLVGPAGLGLRGSF